MKQRLDKPEAHEPAACKPEVNGPELHEPEAVNQRPTNQKPMNQRPINQKPTNLVRGPGDRLPWALITCSIICAETFGASLKPSVHTAKAHAARVACSESLTASTT